MFYLPPTEMPEGNIFTNLCQEFCPKWGCLADTRAHSPAGRQPPLGRHLTGYPPPPPSNDHCSGLCASLLECILVFKHVYFESHTVGKWRLVFELNAFLLLIVLWEGNIFSHVFLSVCLSIHGALCTDPQFHQPFRTQSNFDKRVVGTLLKCLLVVDWFPGVNRIPCWFLFWKKSNKAVQIKTWAWVITKSNRGFRKYHNIAYVDRSDTFAHFVFQPLCTRQFPYVQLWISMFMSFFLSQCGKIVLQDKPNEYINWSVVFVASLGSANSSILTARRLFKDFGEEKNWVGVQSADLFTNDIILQRHNFTGQHVRQRHDVIFVLLVVYEKLE